MRTGAGKTSQTRKAQRVRQIETAARLTALGFTFRQIADFLGIPVHVLSHMRTESQVWEAAILRTAARAEEMMAILSIVRTLGGKSGEFSSMEALQVLAGVGDVSALQHTGRPRPRTRPAPQVADIKRVRLKTVADGYPGVAPISTVKAALRRAAKDSQSATSNGHVASHDPVEGVDTQHVDSEDSAQSGQD